MGNSLPPPTGGAPGQLRHQELCQGEQNGCREHEGGEDHAAYHAVFRQGFCRLGKETQTPGTIRFSTVEIPMRKSSARAKGRATRSSRPATGTGASCGSGSRFVSRLRRNRRDRRVTREAALLPPTTAQQARPGSPEAQWDKSKTVTAIETTCSRISTATSSRIRPAAVKYPS